MSGAKPRPVAIRFGQNLRFFRRRAGLSQEELSRRAALHRAAIGLLERGQRVPGLETVAKLAGVLSVAPGELFRGIEWRAEGDRPGRLDTTPPRPIPAQKPPPGQAGSDRQMRSAHNLELVEAAVLTVVVDIHPDCPEERELIARIAGHPEDPREIETIETAIRGLLDVDLLRRVGPSISPTPAALRATDLLTR